MSANGSKPRWFLVVKPNEHALYEVLRQRLEGSGVEVLLDRRGRERRRGSLGPAMDRRQNDRRRPRPIALLSVAAVPADAAAVAQPAPAAAPTAARAASVRNGPVTHRCPTCAESIELELPRFPHPPARVEMEVGHANGAGRETQHYVEIEAFTVSGRLILSQRVPARRSA